MAEAAAWWATRPRRSQMFKDAEKILVDDVGGVFIDHRWQGNETTRTSRATASGSPTPGRLGLALGQ